QEWHIPNQGADARGITINPLTQQPWITEQSPTVQNGTIAMLDPSISGTLIPSTPIMTPSHASPTILAPLQSQAVAQATTVNPTTRSIINALNGPFTEYSLGPSQPHDSVVDSSGNIWISEPKTNKIARLTLTPNFSLTTSPPAVSLP